jgi:hypothetical protein
VPARSDSSSVYRGAQKGPGTDLSSFPKITWVKMAPFFRFGKTSNGGPWWFCNKGDCRFDLVGNLGTMYAGVDEVVGVLEHVGREMLNAAISSEFLKQRTLWELRYDLDFPLADFSDAGAIALGVTNELSTMYPYDIPQEWARALSLSGFEGIKYRSRFDTRDHSLALAIFDEAGAHKWASGKVCDGNARQIIEILSQLGISVIGRPLLEEMTLL